MFQPDSARAHRACETVELLILTKETPDFIPQALATKQPSFKSSGLQMVVSNEEGADQGGRRSTFAYPDNLERT